MSTDECRDLADQALLIDQSRCAADKLGENDVQVEGLVVMLEAIKACDGTGALKQDKARMGTEIVDDAIDLVNGQSINLEILIPGIMIDKDNVGQYLPKSKGRRKARGAYEVYDSWGFRDRLAGPPQKHYITVLFSPNSTVRSQATEEFLFQMGLPSPLEGALGSLPLRGSVLADREALSTDVERAGRARRSCPYGNSQRQESV